MTRTECAKILESLPDNWAVDNCPDIFPGAIRARIKTDKSFSVFIEYEKMILSCGCLFHAVEIQTMNDTLITDILSMESNHICVACIGQ